mgnify:CR=1 FL=1
MEFSRCARARLAQHTEPDRSLATEFESRHLHRSLKTQQRSVGVEVDVDLGEPAYRTIIHEWKIIERDGQPPE